MIKGKDGKSMGKGAAVSGKGKFGASNGVANSGAAFYLAIPRDECNSILSKGFTCRRRSYVPVSATPSEALSGFSRSARRAGASCARAAVVIEVRSVPASVKCVKAEEGFRLITTHLPAHLLSKAQADYGDKDFGNNVDQEAADDTDPIDATKTNDDALATARTSLERVAQNYAQELAALEKKFVEMEATKTKAVETALCEASKEKDEAVALAQANEERLRRTHAQEVLVLKRELEEMTLTKLEAIKKASINANELKVQQAKVVLLESELANLNCQIERLKQVVDKFADVARPQYWSSKIANAQPTFELIDVTSRDMTSWLSAWMWWSSHEECKIGTVSPWITRVRRLESDAQWLRFQTQIVSMRTYHKQHRIELKPIQPYVWYPPTNRAPSALLDTLQSSMNEHLLFHGTSRQTAEAIVKQGFDIVRVCDGSLYGAGFYFAQEFCKAAQYGRASGSDTTGVVLVCRVALGDVKYHKSGSYKEKQRPKRPDGTVYDALIVEPRPAPNPQVHREFVVHESAQIYVEYVVDYTLPSAF